MAFRRDRASKESASLIIILAVVAAVGLGFTAEFTRAQIGVLGFAGFFSTAYLFGMEFFPQPRPERLPALALLSGIAIGVMAIVLTFEESWRVSEFAWPTDSARICAVAIELLWPILAVTLACWLFVRRELRFSLLAAAFPIVTVLGWFAAYWAEQ